MTETWLLYDDGVGGHHPGYLDSLVSAAQNHGLRPLVAAPLKPPALLEDSNWIPVGTGRLRQVARNWVRLAAAVKQARRMGADAFVDLFFDKNVWPAGAAGHIPRRLHVLHRAEQYDVQSRQGVAGLRAKLLRRRLGTLTSNGAVVVVHSRRAAEIVGSAVSADRLLFAPLPVGIPELLAPVAHHGVPVLLLFVGGGRTEKGLDLLLAAVALLPKNTVLVRVVGLQPDGLIASLRDRFPDVEPSWVDRFVTDKELSEEYQKSSLVVLPYRREFGDRGGASSVLLGALAHGSPLVVTPTLASQLPELFRGYVTAQSESPVDLAAAITSAIVRLDELAADAAETGPKFIAEHHGFDAYVQVLQRAMAMTQ